MSHWPFIIAAYAITIAGALGLTGWSWVAMRRAEKQADSLKRPFVASEVETRFPTSLETNGNISDSVA